MLVPWRVNFSSLNLKGRLDILNFVAMKMVGLIHQTNMYTNPKGQ